MLRNQARLTPWVYCMLVNGLESFGNDAPGSRLRSFRRQHLKEVMIHSLFDTYEVRKRRRPDDNTPYA